MESNFNNDAPPDSGAPPAPLDDAAAPEPAGSESLISPALARFRSCRWMQPAEAGSAEFCTHREVKPYAGTATFDAAAWCPDCVHFKLRRVPKKRNPDDYSY